MSRLRVRAPARPSSTTTQVKSTPVTQANTRTVGAQGAGLSAGVQDRLVGRQLTWRTGCRSGRANRDPSNQRKAMSTPRSLFRPNHTPRRFLALLAILLIAGGTALPSVAPVSARSAPQ